MTRRSPLLLVPVVLLALAGCGSSSSSSSTTAASTGSASSSSSAATSAPAASSGVTISTKTISGVGTVLVNAQGKTLYTFAPDNAKQVTCTGGCASIWPPAALTGSQKAVASGGVKQALLGSDPNPSGGSVVTYHGWPLYTYVQDASAGQDTGQGINSSGGLWYVIAPSGAVIKSG
jgi:predicted lipoprotein with Yx(FWY)xxD motif